MKDLNWDEFPQHPYYLDLAFSDFHAFPTIEQWLGSQQFPHEWSVETSITSYFENITDV